LSITVKHINDPLPLAFLRQQNVPAPIEQIILKMTAKAPADRYQTTAELVGELLRAAAASQIQVPWNLIPVHADPPFPGPLGSGGSSVGPVSLPQPQPQPVGMTPVVVTCFRCQSNNTSDRKYCTSCGYELADRSAAADRVMGPNGRPILARFYMQNGHMAGRSYRFHQDVTTIGRINENSLIINERTVSRKHAQLWFDGGRWYLGDVQSANGTFINGVRLQPHQPAVLNDGDTINFGDEVVLFNIIY
jgi:hypothetical protein